MKTNPKKGSCNAREIGKFGHILINTKSIMSNFKLNRALQNHAAESYMSVGFTRTEEVEALKLEAEARRNLGTVYANVTPMR